MSQNHFNLSFGDRRSAGTYKAYKAVAQLNIDHGYNQQWAASYHQKDGGRAVGLMPNHLAKAIANEFLRKRASPILPSQMYLQKLVYIAHGWNLAVNKSPLITEKSEAWDNGPVYRSIWDHIRDFGYTGNNCMLADVASGHEYTVDLTDEERSVIDHVWSKYGEKNAKQLSDMTHEPNTPWSKAYFNRGRNSSLKDDEIQEHYTQLALAGRK